MEKKIFFLNGNDEIDHNLSEQLRNYEKQLVRPIYFELRQDQFWLKSDRPGEKSIGIDIDEILERHESYFKKTSLKKELLARSIGIKSGKRPKVLDLTAGLLGDSLLMLAMGCEVTSVERNPVVAFLVESALKKAQNPLLRYFKFFQTEATIALNDFQDIQTVFFDPMFEDFNSKASPQKEMRIFRELLGRDEDSEAVLKECFTKPLDRVVVKRPRLSKSLGPKPHVEYIGKSTRYDVYFPKTMAQLS